MAGRVYKTSWHNRGGSPPVSLRGVHGVHWLHRRRESEMDGKSDKKGGLAHCLLSTRSSPAFAKDECGVVLC